MDRYHLMNCFGLELPVNHKEKLRSIALHGLNLIMRHPIRILEAQTLCQGRNLDLQDATDFFNERNAHVQFHKMCRQLNKIDK